MSSIIITSKPKDGEIPEAVAEDLVGLDIGLCTPQGVMCIGLPKLKADIAEAHNAFAVSPEMMIFSLMMAGKKETAKWFDEKFKYRHGNINGDIILISNDCCKYCP